MLAPNPYLIHNKWFILAARHSVCRILIRNIVIVHSAKNFMCLMLFK